MSLAIFVFVNKFRFLLLSVLVFWVCVFYLPTFCIIENLGCFLRITEEVSVWMIWNDWTDYSFTSFSESSPIILLESSSWPNPPLKRKRSRIIKSLLGQLPMGLFKWELSIYVLWHIFNSKSKVSFIRYHIT